MQGDDVLGLQQRLEGAESPSPARSTAVRPAHRAGGVAFEKLMLGTPREQATGEVTPAMWETMNGPIQVPPRRAFARGGATQNHTEVYLPEQVVVFFVNDGRR